MNTVHKEFSVANLEILLRDFLVDNFPAAIFKWISPHKVMRGGFQHSDFLVNVAPTE